MPENADLIVHGEVDETRMVLNIRFIAQGSSRSAWKLLMTDRLSLPFNLPEFAKLLVAAAVAATVPDRILSVNDAAHFVQCV